MINALVPVERRQCQHGSGGGGVGVGSEWHVALHSCVQRDPLVQWMRQTYSTSIPELISHFACE